MSNLSDAIETTETRTVAIAGAVTGTVVVWEFRDEGVGTPRQTITLHCTPTAYGSEEAMRGGRMLRRVACQHTLGMPCIEEEFDGYFDGDESIDTMAVKLLDYLPRRDIEEVRGNYCHGCDTYGDIMRCAPDVPVNDDDAIAALAERMHDTSGIEDTYRDVAYRLHPMVSESEAYACAHAALIEGDAIDHNHGVNCEDRILTITYPAGLGYDTRRAVTHSLIERGAVDPRSMVRETLR